MDYAFNGRVQSPSAIGARAPPPRASTRRGRGPVAIAVESEAQWQALREAMDDLSWARDASLATAEGRRARHDLIDRALAAWTRGFDHHQLMHRLQQRGVPAGAVLSRGRATERCAARSARLVGRAGAARGRRGAPLHHDTLAPVRQSIQAEHSGAAPGRAQRSCLSRDLGSGPRGIPCAPGGRCDQHRAPLVPRVTPAGRR